jgi:hypothetical protein
VDGKHDGAAANGMMEKKLDKLSVLRDTSSLKNDVVFKIILYVQNVTK